MLLAAFAAAVVCGFQTIRASRLIAASAWLAGVSASTAGLFYTMGAHELAVIELSVGVGLVTVLLVFAITMAGDPVEGTRPILPKPLVWSLLSAALLLLGAMILRLPERSGGPVPQLAQVLWQQRGLDVVVQIILIFAGVLGILGLLSEEKRPTLQGAGRDLQRPESGPALEEVRR